LRANPRTRRNAEPQQQSIDVDLKASIEHSANLASPDSLGRVELSNKSGGIEASVVADINMRAVDRSNLDKPRGDQFVDPAWRGKVFEFMSDGDYLVSAQSRALEQNSPGRFIRTFARLDYRAYRLSYIAG
jgi:hypothetical protein